MTSVNTEKKFKKDDLEFFKNKVENIIPPSHKILKEKFEYIIDYNIYLIDNYHIDFNDYLKDNIVHLSISATDKTRIKKYLLDYNADNPKESWFILNNDATLLQHKRLTLFDIYKFYFQYYKSNNDNEIALKESKIESYSSIKIYDFYKNTDDKNKFFENHNIQKIMASIYSKVKKIEVLSILDTEVMHSFFSTMNDVYKDKIEIKHIVDSQYSYIPSIFFVLIRFKVYNSNNYKEYIFYLENEINWGVASYVSKTTFSKQFFELLESRFDIQFRNPENIKFLTNEKKESFENSVKNIIIIIEDFLKISSENSEELEEKIQMLKHKLIVLKLNYPKMNYAYKLLSRIIKYISIIKNISSISNNEKLPKTVFVMKQILENKVNLNIDNMLNSIMLKQISKEKNINIIQLRKSIFVNLVANTQYALCDLFEELNWNNLNSILNSLYEIEVREELLNKLFSYFGSINETLSFEEMQSLFQNKFLKQIYRGEPISLNVSSISNRNDY